MKSCRMDDLEASIPQNDTVTMKYETIIRDDEIVMDNYRSE